MKEGSAKIEFFNRSPPLTTCVFTVSMIEDGSVLLLNRPKWIIYTKLFVFDGKSSFSSHKMKTFGPSKRLHKKISRVNYNKLFLRGILGSNHCISKKQIFSSNFFQAIFCLVCFFLKFIVFFSNLLFFFSQVHFFVLKFIILFFLKFIVFGLYLRFGLVLSSSYVFFESIHLSLISPVYDRY